MATLQTVFRAFVSCPAELSEERDAISQAIRELNLVWSNTLSARIDLLSWELSVYPGVGSEPQDVINQQIGDDYDIFIGLMWTRFGTPTAQYGSGTEEEFSKALERQRRSPQDFKLLFYFKEEPVSPSKLDLKQLMAVMKFKESMPKEGVLYGDFTTTSSFLELIRIHLSRAVQDLCRRSSVEDKVDVEQYSNKIETSDDIEEFGFLDSLEAGHQWAEKLNDVLGRMNEAIEELGGKLTKRAETLNKVGTPQSLDKVRKAKMLLEQVAFDLDSYSLRIEAESPLFSESLQNFLHSIQKAMSILPEFEGDHTEAIQNYQDQASALAYSIFQEAMPPLEGFLTTLKDSPSMSQKFTKSRRRAVRATENLMESMKTSGALLNETISFVSDAEASKLTAKRK